MKPYCLQWMGTVLLWAAAVITANSQTPDPNLTPHEPLISRVPDGSWTIDYKYKAVAPDPKTGGAKSGLTPPVERVATIRVDKKGSSYHVVTTESSGRKAEHWCINGTEIYREAGTESFVKLAKNSSFYINFGNTDFDELSWMGTDNYKGVETRADGGKLFVFEVKNKDRKQTAQESTITGDLSVMVERLGMVDAKGDKKEAIAKLMESEYGDTLSHVTLDAPTQLPLVYDNGKIVRSYTYTAEPLAVPRELTKFFTDMEQQKRKETVPAPRP